MRQKLVNTECLEKIYHSLDLKEPIDKINNNLDGKDIFRYLRINFRAIYLDSDNQTVKNIINRYFNPLYLMAC